MDDVKFLHMLKLSAIYVDLMRSRQFFDGLDEADDGDRHNILNCLEIVANTFVEMQRRLNVKPVFTVKANAALGEKS